MTVFCVPDFKMARETHILPNWTDFGPAQKTPPKSGYFDQNGVIFGPLFGTPFPSYLLVYVWIWPKKGPKKGSQNGPIFDHF